MSEVARLNLSGGFNPAGGVSNNNLADQMNRRSQSLMNEAVTRFKLEGMVEERDERMAGKRAGKYVLENMDSLNDDKIDMFDSKTWSFTDPNRKKSIIKDWETNVGGKYEVLAQMLQAKEASDTQNLANSYQMSKLGYDLNDEDEQEQWRNDISRKYDQLTDGEKKVLMTRLPPEVLQEFGMNYRKEKGPSFWEKTQDTMGWGVATVASGLGTRSFYKSGFKGGKYQALAKEMSEVDLTKFKGKNKNIRKDYMGHVQTKLKEALEIKDEKKQGAVLKKLKKKFNEITFEMAGKKGITGSIARKGINKALGKKGATALIAKLGLGAILGPKLAILGSIAMAGMTLWEAYNFIDSIIND